MNLWIYDLLKRRSFAQNDLIPEKTETFLFFQLSEFSRCKVVFNLLISKSSRGNTVFRLDRVLLQEEMCKYLFTINIAQCKYQMYLFQTFLSHLLIVLVLVPAVSLNCQISRVSDHKSIQTLCLVLVIQ